MIPYGTSRDYLRQQILAVNYFRKKKLHHTYEWKYSRMDQVKFVEDSL